MAIMRGRVNLAMLLCGFSGTLFLGGCCSTAQNHHDSSQRKLRVIGVFGNNMVSDKEVHLWAGRKDKVVWFSNQAISTLVSFKLSSSQMNPFMGMSCDQPEGQARVCTISCSDPGTCVAGDITPNLKYPPPPNNFLRFDYEVTVAEMAKADPVIIIHEAQ